MMIPEEDTGLPVLRSDIQLNEAPPEPEGAPTWTLYDPAANKYYKIGWLEFEALTRFKHCQTVSQLIKRIESETTLHPDEDTIKILLLFLIRNNLVLTTGAAVADHFEAEKEKKQKQWWEKILHGYLFFTIPLFKPEKFLNKTYPYVRFFFTRHFMVAVLALLSYGIYLSFQRFDEFSTTFISYLNFEGVVLFLTATILVKIVHELGHAYTATKYGVPVSVMGVAFIVMYPVLYSETTNAWKLQSRRDRLNIAAAGVMSEIALASVALLLWHVSAPGVLQSLCFMVAVVSLAASLIVNLNPLMRFDGYYLFSDLVGFDNLQDRSFSFARWKLRQVLWRWDDEPPEVIPDERRNFLIAFGFSTWIYRLFLYLGIALLVYHVFFQPLGLILMLVELAYFIALPVFREMRVWVSRAEDIRASARAKIIFGFLAILIVLAFMPLHKNVDVPAVLHASAYTRLYAPIPAKIDEIMVVHGQRVEQGQSLFRLSSPHLDYNISLVSQRLKALQEIRGSSQANLGLAQKRVTIDSEIEGAKKELEGYQAIKEQLNIKAPYAGVIRDVDQALHPGQSISSHQTLGLLVDDRNHVLSGYVREQDIGRISEGNSGTFFAEFSFLERYEVTLQQIDETSVTEIFWPELASVNNGPLPAEQDQSGQIKALPRYTLYAAKFQLNDQAYTKDIPDFVARGTIRLKAAPTNFANLLIKRVVSVVIREGGL